MKFELIHIFTITGIVWISNISFFLGRNIFHYLKHKSLLKDQKDLEIQFLKKENKFLEKEIESQKEEIATITSLIYKNL